MKMTLTGLTLIVMIVCGITACNNDSRNGSTADTNAVAATKKTDTVMLDIKDITIPDRAWVRQCQDAYKALFVSPSLPDNTPGNDGVIKKNAYSFGTAFSKTEFVDWVNKMAANTNCDRFMIRYGIYPATGKPNGVPSSGLAHLKPNRLTCFVWAYNGDKPAVYLNKATGDTTDPYNLGEIHP